ncbi:MAG: 3-oxoacyl-[acyl-carrier-protein] reductase [Chloroflexi bacterium]|nr:3-oxoacyl-[acyl-carrier-protein] reductase [Chloroflexota bacterium]
MRGLAGKIALVTGASRGIGRGIALRLAEEGCKVVVNYNRSADAAQEVVEQIKAQGGEAVAIQADVSDYKEAQRLVKEALQAFGRIDILVNNAGTTRDQLLLMMKESDWDLVINTNLKSCYNVTKAALRSMMKQRYGRIINITSVVGLAGQAGQSNYAASKAGMIGFTKSLAKEVGPRNITVNAVAPGYVPTDLTTYLPEELIKEMIQLTPVRRAGTPEDIAAAVAFLASDDASFITGHVLTVDGGLVMQS